MGEFCEATREAYGDLIKKPPLTDKLLGKPPFKFLADLIQATISNAGYLDGLYSEEEIAGAGTSKETKVAFLEKAITAAELASGQKLEAKPSKIVAGQEPEKTNAFLQALARAARAGDSDGSDIVAKVQAGEKLSASNGSAGSNKENGVAAAKPKAESPEKKKSRRKEGEDRSGSKEKRSSSKDKKPSSKDDKKRSSRDKDPKEKSKPRRKERESSKEAPPKSPERGEPSNVEASPPPDDEPITNGFHEEKQPALSEKPRRPMSPDPAPRLVEPRQDSASSQRETAGLIQPDAEEKAEEDAFIVEEPVGGSLALSGSEDERVDADDLDAAEHGGLVRKILETKKELESGLGSGRGGSGRVRVAAYDEKERERTRKETAKLQAAVQDLTKAAHPLEGGRRCGCRLSGNPVHGLLASLVLLSALTLGWVAATVTAYAHSKEHFWLWLGVVELALLVPIAVAPASVCTRRLGPVAAFTATTVARAAVEFAMACIVFGWMGWESCHAVKVCDLTGYEYKWNFVIGTSFLTSAFVSFFCFLSGLDYCKALRAEAALKAAVSGSDDAITQTSLTGGLTPAVRPGWARGREAKEHSGLSGLCKALPGRKAKAQGSAATVGSSSEWASDYFDDETKNLSLRLYSRAQGESPDAGPSHSRRHSKRSALTQLSK